ncbi:MAG: hypothetical protein ABI721_03135 [Candidatus Dojkabacteria bacterium]
MNNDLDTYKSPEQVLMIQLTDELSEELVLDAIDNLSEDDTAYFEQMLSEGSFTNFEVYGWIIDKLNIEDPLNNYNITTPKEEVQKNIIGRVRKYFLTATQIEERNMYTPEEIELLQEMMEDSDFYKENRYGGLSRDYESMLELLDVDGKKGITIIALAELVKKLIRLGVIVVPEELHPYKKYTEHDREIIQSVINIPEVRNPVSKGLIYEKIIPEIDPNGLRRITRASIMQYILQLKSKKLIEVIEPRKKYAGFSDEDLDNIEQMLNNPDYRMQFNLRNYNLMIDVLDPNKTRNLTEEKLRRVIKWMLDKGYEENIKIDSVGIFNNIRKPPERFTGKMLESDIDLINKIINLPEYRDPRTQARNMKAILEALNPEGVRDLNEGLVRNFIAEMKAEKKIFENVEFLNIGRESVLEGKQDLVRELLNSRKNRSPNEGVLYDEIIKKLGVKVSKVTLRRFIINNNIVNEIPYRPEGRKSPLAQYKDDIQRMLNDRSYRIEPTMARNYNMMAGELGVDSEVLKSYVEKQIAKSANGLTEAFKYDPSKR